MALWQDYTDRCSMKETGKKHLDVELLSPLNHDVANFKTGLLKPDRPSKPCVSKPVRLWAAATGMYWQFSLE